VDSELFNQQLSLPAFQMPSGAHHLHQDATQYGQPEQVGRSVCQLVVPRDRQLQRDSKGLYRVQQPYKFLLPSAFDNRIDPP
jgi:hypothetical protein